MPSKHKHWKDGHRIKELKCKSGHPGCTDGHYTAFRQNDHRERPIWEVQWWPCRQEEAIAYMKRKHGYNYRPGPGEDREKSKDKSQGHKQSKKSSNPRVPSLSQQNTAAAQAPGPYQNAPAQPSTPRQNQRHQTQPPTFSTGAHMPMDLSQQQKKSSRKEAWMAGNMASNPNMAVSQSAAVAQNMASAPMMPSPQVLHDGQQQQQGRHRRHRSSHRPEPVQDQQPPVPMMPAAPAPLAVAPAPAPAPVGSPLHASPDAQRHRPRRPHKSSREHGPGPGLEPKPELGEDMQPPSDFPPNCMLASMAAMARAAGPEMQNMALRPRPQPSMSVPPLASPIGMPMPRATIPVRPTLNVASLSAGQETPGMPGPLSMQFRMGEPPVEGVIAAQKIPISIGPTDTTMAPCPSQNMPTRVLSNQQEAAGMPLAPLKPMPAPLTQKNLTRLQRAQPPRGILKPTRAPGVPGPQRPPVLPTGGGGELTSAVVVMPPDPRMQPPPTSMPAFPGTPPPALGGPVPPPAPTPPQLFSPPGTPLPPQ